MALVRFGFIAFPKSSDSYPRLFAVKKQVLDNVLQVLKFSELLFAKRIRGQKVNKVKSADH